MRGGASITLEPGAQLELSGDKAENVHQVCAELRAHLREIDPISKAMGVRWLGVGFHPLARREDFEWVPKQRYAVMREYLPTRGGHALDMMLRTCTVQVNLDYASEADAMRKMRVALALAPATTAMFANSPWKDGRPHGGVYVPRARLARRRSGSHRALSRSLEARQPLRRLRGMGARRPDVPLQAGRARDREHRADRSAASCKSGFEGHSATMEDWKTHLNTIFPEVRLKKTIEVRGADVQSTDLACALPALWTGILYDDRALAEAEALVEGWTHDEVADLRTRAWRDGLRATFRGGSLVGIAQRMVAIADGGLERRGVVDTSCGKDERVHLARLRKLVGEGRCPADALLDGLDRQPDPTRAIIDRSTLT